MGYFTCATTGSKTKVEYTFGYTRCDDGKVRIFLHHSSVPYAAAVPAKDSNSVAITENEALSYFVGGSVVEDGYKEDGGFAINGGKGWSNCTYDNHQIELKGGIALAMGNYYFTCATTGSKTKVEYTFGYTRCDDGKVRIFLHHSSLPYGS